MIQAVVSRMAAESARMKQFALTAVGVLASVSEAADAPLLALVGCILSIIFWLLDARYLQQERWFRSLFDDVRAKEGYSDFGMNPSEQTRNSHKLSSACFSWPTLPIYLALLGVCTFLAIAIDRPSP